MNIIFRVDASIQIGSGHVMRCLTLADALAQEGATCIFMSRQHRGNLLDFIQSKGYHVVALPVNKVDIAVPVHSPRQEYVSWLGATIKEDAQQIIDVIQSITTDKPDWLIVDHYALDAGWEKLLRPYCKKVMVIDDLADRQHDCDLLIDQNFYKNQSNRYDNLVSINCIKLLGPKYVILRSEFFIAREKLRERKKLVKNIIVFFGGIDIYDFTSQLILFLTGEYFYDFEINIIVGENNINKEKIKILCEGHQNFKYYCQCENIANLISSADIAIAAGGSVIWEFCFLKLPSIVFITADNQKEAIQSLSEKRIVYNLGNLQYIDKEKISKIKEIINNINDFFDRKMINNMMENHQGAKGIMEAMYKI